MLAALIVCVVLVVGLIGLLAYLAGSDDDNHWPPRGFA